MKQFRHLLVGIDYSDASRSALRTAIRLAAFDNATVTAVHILDPRLAEAMQRVNGFSESALLKNVRDSIRRFITDSEFGAETVGIHLEVDHPFVGLVSACHKLQADLLVLGTRGTNHRPNEVGAVAAKCVRKAPSDVLLVREGTGGPFKKALVCVDFSETSAEAIKVAGHIAEADGTSLDCVFVYEPPVVMDYGGFLPAIPLDESAVIQAFNKDLLEFTGPLLQPYPSVEWHGEVHRSMNIRDTLIGHAHDHGSDLVVMGTRGKTNLQTFLIGTTAESMVRHAACSVLAIKPPPKHDASAELA